MRADPTAYVSAEAMSDSSPACESLRRAIAELKKARALFNESGHLALAAHTEMAIGRALAALQEQPAAPEAAD